MAQGAHPTALFHWVLMLDDLLLLEALCMRVVSQWLLKSQSIKWTSVRYVCLLCWSQHGFLLVLLGRLKIQNGQTVVCEVFLLKDMTSETSQCYLKLFVFPHGS